MSVELVSAGTATIATCGLFACGDMSHLMVQEHELLRERLQLRRDKLQLQEALAAAQAEIQRLQLA